MTHIYAKGQVVIPKQMLKMLHWEVGMPVRPRVEGNCIILERQTSIVDELEAMAKAHPISIKADYDFDAEYDRAIRRKWKKIGLD